METRVHLGFSKEAVIRVVFPNEGRGMEAERCFLVDSRIQRGLVIPAENAAARIGILRHGD